MYSTSEVLGACPDCGTAIPDDKRLIEYETSTGTAVYAECPECSAVVHPA